LPAGAGHPAISSERAALVYIRGEIHDKAA